MSSLNYHAVVPTLWYVTSMAAGSYINISDCMVNRSVAGKNMGIKKIFQKMGKKKISSLMF